MSSFDNFYKNALIALKEGNTDEARENLIEAEKSFVESSDVDKISQEDIFVLRASIELSANDLKLAEKYFEKALQVNKDSVEACLGLGKVYYSSNMLGQAKTMFEWAFKISDNNESAKEHLKLINEELGFEADHIADDSTKDDRLDITEYFDEAYELFMEDKYEETLRHISKIEDAFAKEINLLKGNTYLGMNILEKAGEAFQSILEVDPKSGEACNGLAEMFLKQGKKEDAKTMFECALEYNPSDQFALLGLAEINQELGLSPTHSMTNFFSKKNISEKTNNIINDAYKLFVEKQFDDSIKLIEELEQSADFKNENHEKEMEASLCNLKGFNFLGLDDLENAQKLFEKSLELNPNSSQACAGLGEILFLSGDDQSAKIMFEWALKNNYKNEFAKKGLAKVNSNLELPDNDNSLDLGIDEEVHKDFNTELSEAYRLFDQKQYQQAIEKLEKVETLLDRDSINTTTKKTISSVMNFKGFCNLSLSKNDDAKELFEESLQFNPNSSQACAGLGEVLYLDGNDNQAKKMFEWALRNDSNNKFAEAGLTKVNTALGLKENDNTMVQGELSEISNEISELIDIGYSLYQEKKYDDSLEKLSEAEKLVDLHYSKEDSVATLASLNNFKGFNYLGLNNNSRAKVCFEKSLEINSESSQACAGLGEILFLEKDDESAKEMFEYAVKYNPQNAFAKAGLEKVNKALGLEAMHNTQLEETV